MNHPALCIGLLSIALSCDGSNGALDNRPRDDAGDGEEPKDSGRSADENQRDSAGFDSGVDDHGSSEQELQALCSSEICDLIVADSCGEDQACRFLLPIGESITPFAQCQPAGTKLEGEPCSSTAECGPGLDCTVECDTDTQDCAAEENRGYCRSYCCALNSTSHCPREQACLIELTDGEGRGTGVGLCDLCDNCNPLMAEDCDYGRGCYPLPDVDSEEISFCFLCMTSDPGLSEGARCDTANECKPGLGCFSIDRQPNRCTRFCDLKSGIDVCQPEGLCQDYLGAASRGGVLGICIPNR